MHKENKEDKIKNIICKNTCGLYNVCINVKNLQWIEMCQYRNKTAQEIIEYITTNHIKFKRERR